MAAHDRTTLPSSANPDPGPEGKQGKDCTHRSNAEDEEEEASASEKGKASAPGQLKRRD
jgi:hypothetical protein